MRIGQGIDVHPLVNGRPLILGGVTIPFDRGLAGDTDGDVLTHALMDALLGALSFGDLGSWFKPDDPDVRGQSSVNLLTRVMDLVRQERYRIVNCDTTIVAERPRMRPYVANMRNILAPHLAIAEKDLSIKATTTDRLGFLGQGEGILATAVVLLDCQ